MKIFNISSKYNNKRLYNIVDVVEEFPNYFNMSIKELEIYFKNYSVVSKEEIINYLKEKYHSTDNLDKIIIERMHEYDYYIKVLSLLSTKVLKYIEVIKYLCNCKENDENKNFYEELLEKIQIYHYSSIVVGEDISRLLIVLFHSLNKFNNTLEEINQKDKFEKERMDSLFFSARPETIYPSEKLIVIDDYYLDKTSLKIKQKIR